MNENMNERINKCEESMNGKTEREKEREKRKT
jgi:hypothetical protein